VVNLLDNAARHGPPGGHVRVRAFAHGEELMIEVRDEGPGIAEAERDRVFERFTRGERAGGGGTGLGLAIARWVVGLHGGTIAVVEPDAVDGEPLDAAGCRIRVALPAKSR
jgi:signal transduction histidine kinase